MLGANLVVNTGANCIKSLGTTLPSCGPVKQQLLPDAGKLAQLQVGLVVGMQAAREQPQLQQVLPRLPLNLVIDAWPGYRLDAASAHSLRPSPDVVPIMFIHAVRLLLCVMVWQLPLVLMT